MVETGLVKQLSLLLVLCGSVGAQQVRCALVVDKDEDLRSSPLVSLLEARLSQDGHVQLVERSRIDAILREQQINLTATVDPNALVRAGRILRADAFILLSSESPAPAGPPTRPVGQLLRMRVVETAHGLRLCDRYEELDPSNVQGVADRIAERVHLVMQKMAQPAGQVVPVGIVDIHRVQLPDRYERLARVLPGLLSARLSAEPRLLMLERESLGTLLKEKQLTDANDAAFWNSAVLIDGYLQPDPNGGLQIELRLRRFDGSKMEPLVMPVDPNGPALAVDRAGSRIVQSLQIRSAYNTWESAKEAEEFYSQGLLLLRHGRSGSIARSMFETAHALKPSEIKYGLALLRSMRAQSARTSDANAGERVAAEACEMASTLARQIHDAHADGSLQARDAWMCSTSVQGYFGDPLSTATDQIRLINRENRKIVVEVIDRAAQEIAQQTPDFLNYRIERARTAWFWSDDPNETMARVRDCYAEAIMPSELGGKCKTIGERIQCCDSLVLLSLYAGRIPGAERGSRLHVLWSQYIDELTRVDDPIVRLFALLSGIGPHATTIAAPSDSVRICRQITTIVQEELPNIKEPIPERWRSRIAQHVTMSIEMCQASTADQARALERIYLRLVEERNAHALALMDLRKAAHILMNVSGDKKAHYRQLLDRMEEVLQGGNDDPAVAKALVTLQGEMREAQRWQKQANPAANSKSIRCTMLLRTNDWPADPWGGEGPLRICGRGAYAEISEDLLLLGLLFDSQVTVSRMIGVAVIDLKTLRLISVQCAKFPLIPSSDVLRSIKGLTLLGDTAYVAVEGKGVFCFPRVLSPGKAFLDAPQVLNEENGLPSPSVTSLAQDGRGLWVAYGGQSQESGLGWYDPGTQRWNSVLCSARTGNPPFEAGQPVPMSGLTVIPPNQVVFSIMQSGMSERVWAYDGVWTLDTETRKLTQCQLYGTITAAGRKLLVKSPESLIEFDPRQNRAILLAGRTWWARFLPGGRITGVEFHEEPFISDSVARQLSNTYGHSGGVYLQPAVVHEGKLWTLGSHRLIVIPAGAAMDDVAIMDNNLLNGREVESLLSTPYGLIGVGAGMAGLIGIECQEEVDTNNRSLHGPGSETWISILRRAGVSKR